MYVFKKYWNIHVAPYCYLTVHKAETETFIINIDLPLRKTNGSVYGSLDCSFVLMCRFMCCFICALVSSSPSSLIRPYRRQYQVNNNILMDWHVFWTVALFREVCFIPISATWFTPVLSSASEFIYFLR